MPEQHQPGPGHPRPGQSEVAHAQAVRPEAGRPEAGQSAVTQAAAGRRPGWPDGATTAAVYAVLVLLGLAQGVFGAFFFAAGPVPLAAIIFDLLIFSTCLFGGWGARRPAGALAPAVGWFCATFVLAMSTPAGSIVITAGSAGEWFLFGGAASAAAGVVAGFVIWSRASAVRSGAIQSGAVRSGAVRSSTRRPRP